MQKSDPFADHLLARGLVDAAGLARAREHQLTAGGPLPHALIELGMLTEPVVTEALATALHISRIELAGVEVDPEVLALVPFELALEHGVLPVALTLERGLEVLTLAMVDPTSKTALEAVTVQAGFHVRPFVAGEASLFAAMRRLYAGTWAASAPPPMRSLAAFDAVTMHEREPSLVDVSWGKQFREFMREVRAQGAARAPAEEVQRLAEAVIEEAKRPSFDPWEASKSASFNTPDAAVAEKPGLRDLGGGKATLKPTEAKPEPKKG